MGTTTSPHFDAACVVDGIREHSYRIWSLSAWQQDGTQKRVSDILRKLDAAEKFASDDDYKVRWEWDNRGLIHQLAYLQLINDADNIYHAVHYADNTKLAKCIDLKRFNVSSSIWDVAVAPGIDPTIRRLLTFAPTAVEEARLAGYIYSDYHCFFRDDRLAKFCIDYFERATTLAVIYTVFKLGRIVCGPRFGQWLCGDRMSPVWITRVFPDAWSRGTVQFDKADTTHAYNMWTMVDTPDGPASGNDVVTRLIGTAAHILYDVVQGERHINVMSLEQLVRLCVHLPSMNKRYLAKTEIDQFRTGVRGIAERG